MRATFISTQSTLFTSPRRAGRGRGSEATEGEGASPRLAMPARRQRRRYFPVSRAQRRGPLTPTLSPRGGEREMRRNFEPHSLWPDIASSGAARQYLVRWRASAIAFARGRNMP